MLRRAPLCLLIALTLLAAPVAAVQIVEFCPDPYRAGEPDEYFVLEAEGSLDGVAVTDGEGTLKFPPNSMATGQVTVAREATGFLRTHGRLPDYEILDTDPTVSGVLGGGRFRLANKEDSIALLIDGATVQEVEWPEDVEAREGQVHFLEGGVWDPHPRLLGQSRFFPETFENATVTLFVSPDCSYEVFESALGTAKKRVEVNVYEFTHPGIAAMLAEAGDRGVEVSVLLEGGPVGGISPEEEAVAATLTAHGAEVRMMTSTPEAHAKYRFDHAKYFVVDNESVLITSENFKPSGIPEPGMRGNRGWGAWVEDTRVARYFATVYRWDTRGGDIAAAPTGGRPGEDGGYEEYDPAFSPLTVRGARVTPILAPETSSMVVNLIAEADEQVLIEQASIRNSTAGGPNRFLAAAIDAARRGVEVRVLLDAAWFNVEGAKDNDEMVTWINEVARTEKLPLEARCIDLDAAGLVKVHTKGVIVDNSSVLISSINWNDNSADFNREAGVIIEHPEAAGYFVAAFEADWEAGGQTLNETYDSRLIWAAGIVFVFFILYLLRRKRR
ncbi:phospholipase [Methanofollis aquaemaris]|uniref:Phospholipase n=1 Tax=Methanofollis aquaemaris TaxID=126734 RepID=A0A8A3S6X0_9EURY|nr:phospholipase D-like domain-containing protein [Methanofollis aquaemaris]QSZ67404.1 phospholipase [Methanofollis aquaemaris]